MTQVSEHFTLEEVTHSVTAARFGIDNSLPESLLPAVKNTATNLELVRTLIGKPILIDSWYRCLPLNSALGSKPTSQHILGEAVDFRCPEFGTPFIICQTLLSSPIQIPFDQLILEHTWVHISFCSNPASKPRRQTLSLLKSGGYALGLTDVNGVLLA